MSKILAYAVQEDGERTGGIYYARHRISALKKGASDFGDGEIGGMTCHRVPWADQYAPGPCPKLVMIENGWWFECYGCGVTINRDYEAYGEDDEILTLNPVERGASIYCTQECDLRDNTRTARIKAREAEAIEWMALSLLRKFPDVELSGNNHSYCSDGETIQQCIIGFKFKGCKIGDANYRSDKVGELPYVTVCGGDLDAWREFVASHNEEIK